MEVHVSAKNDIHMLQQLFWHYHSEIPSSNKYKLEGAIWDHVQKHD